MWNYFEHKTPAWRFVILCLLCFGIIGYIMHKRELTPCLTTHALLTSSNMGQVTSLNIFDKTRATTLQKEKYIIYRCNDLYCGGLADRQKGMITAYVLAEMMGRMFGIKMVSPCDFSKYVIPNEVDWIIADTKLKHLSKEYLLNLDGMSLNLVMETADLRKMFKKDVTFYTGNMDYVPYLMKNPLFHDVFWAQNESHHSVFKIAFERLFKLSAQTKEKLNQVISRIDRSVEHLLCAHIRIGKSRTLPKDNKRRLRPDLNTLIRFLKRRLHPGYDKLFIATDSEDVRIQFKQEFSDMFTDVEGKIVHVDRSGRTYDCSGMEKAIMDQFLLSVCDTLVMSVSGFSRIAAIVRGTDHGLFLASGKTITKTKRLDPTV